jgi:RNA polymerase sigma-70 factor (ECF subfamily)
MLDEVTLTKLLRTHHDRLLKHIAKRLSPNRDPCISAEDLFQETLTQAWRDIGDYEFRGPAAFYRWLKTIAEHRLQDALKAARTAKRGGGRRPVPVHNLDGSGSELGLPSHDPTPSRSAARRERARALRVALSGLKEVYRQAINLRYFECLSVADVAAQMSRSEGAVLMLCQRGLSKLRKALGSLSQYLSSQS